jgi:hypothetical protein
MILWREYDNVHVGNIKNEPGLPFPRAFLSPFPSTARITATKSKET